MANTKRVRPLVRPQIIKRPSAKANGVHKTVEIDLMDWWERTVSGKWPQGGKHLPWEALAQVNDHFFIPAKPNAPRNDYNHDNPLNRVTIFVRQSWRKKQSRGDKRQMMIIRMEKHGREGVGVWRVK